MQRLFIFICFIVCTTLACGGASPAIPPIPEVSVFDSNNTLYGFFPSPPEATLESIFKLFKDMGEHGDFVLIQQNTDWEGFAEGGIDGESQTRTDLINQTKLAYQNHLEYIFVIDALNGLNRREFIGLPSGWEASFANADVRSAYKNYALWVVRSFHPRYLGLASEINTYMDAYPDDAKNFISLYNEIYSLVKAESPETQIFVSFQWDDLNNMFPQPEEGNRKKFDTNWDQVEAFEPNLDVWAISSYPYFIFSSGTDIPADYYSPLLARTPKPIAIAEGGYTSRNIGAFISTPEDQLAYINTLHTQLGPRLAFWVNTILNDFSLDSYAKEIEKDGRGPKDVETLGYFAYTGLRNFDGFPKPAMEAWDSFRSSSPERDH